LYLKECSDSNLCASEVKENALKPLPTMVPADIKIGHSHMPLQQHSHSCNLPFALVKIQLEPCASLDCGEVDDEDYYTVPEHYEDVPVDVELDMHVDFDDIEDLQHLEEEVTRLGGKDRDVMVEQALPSRSRARTAHQLQLSKNLLSQLEDNMRLKVSQTPRPIDPNNILHLLDSILQPSTFWHSGTVARQSPGRQRQYSKMTTWTRWVRVSSNISWNSSKGMFFKTRRFMAISRSWQPQMQESGRQDRRNA